MLGLGNNLANQSYVGISNLYSFDLDSTDDYISIADTNDLSFGDSSNDSAFSVSAWLNIGDATDFPILSKGIYNNKGEYRIESNGSKYLAFSIFDESVNNTFEKITSDADIESYEGSWIHVVFTYNGVGGTSANGGMVMYLNGAVFASTASDDGNYVAMENGNQAVYIGRYSSQYGDGIVDEVSVWSSALSASEVSNMYNNGMPTMLKGRPGLIGWWRMGDGTEQASGVTVYDMSTNSNNATINGAGLSPTYSTTALG